MLSLARVLGAGASGVGVRDLSGGGLWLGWGLEVGLDLGMGPFIH